MSPEIHQQTTEQESLFGLPVAIGEDIAYPEDEPDNLFFEPTDEELRVEEQVMAEQERPGSPLGIPTILRRTDMTNDDMPSALTAYIQSIEQIPTLTKQEEIDLFVQITTGVRARKQFSDVGGVDDERNRQLQEIQNGLNAEKKVTLANTGLVISIAKRYTRQGISFLDLIQEGNTGLMHAVKRFDVTRGYRFSTYATWCIRGAITHAICHDGRTVRLPDRAVKNIQKLHKLRHGLTQRYGREPTIEEYADAMSLSEEAIIKLIKLSRRSIYFSEPVKNDVYQNAPDTNDLNIGEAISSATVLYQRIESPEQELIAKEMKTELVATLDLLKPKQTMAIRIMTGLHDNQPRTLEETGKLLGISKEAVRQLVKRGIDSLSDFERNKLQVYLNRMA